MNKINKLLSKYDTISFDIYETLLIRLFAKPMDLLKYIEYQENCKNFYQERLQAERIARTLKKPLEDITYDDIYKYMPTNLLYMKEIELEYEKKYTTVHAKNLQIYKEALKQGKNIILISDMYLPKEFIKEMLYQHGIVGFSEIFISGEIGKTKLKGSLYPYVLSKLNTKGANILHIGDSIKNDIKQAKKYKIKTYRVIPYLEEFLQKKQNFKFKMFYNKTNQDLFSGILVSIFAYHELCNKIFSNFNEQLGYYIAGISAYSYVQYIISISQDYDTILFVARDGFLLQKLYNYLATNKINNEYVHAQRIFNYTTHINLKNKYTSLKLYLCQHGININKYIFHFNKKKYFKKYRMELKNWSRENFARYKEYFNTLNIKGKNVLCVDMMTFGFTSKKVISRMLENQNVRSVFFSTSNEKIIKDVYIYIPREMLFQNKNRYFLIEPLFSSCHPPTIDFYSGKPVYSEMSPQLLKLQQEKIANIENGMFNFVEEIKVLFGEVIFPIDIINSYFKYFLKYASSEDINGYKSIPLSDGDVRNEYNTNLYTKLQSCIKWRLFR